MLRGYSYPEMVSNKHRSGCETCKYIPQTENTEELYKKKKKKHNTPQKGALDFLIILIAFQL